MPWWVGTIAGSVCLAFINSWAKTQDIGLRTQLIVLVPLILCNLGYWYGFRNAPSFIGCWYTGSALNAITAYTLSIFLFDKSINVYTIAGVACIILGQQLLMR